MGGKRICRHCCKNKVNRPRGLCWGCFYAPGVRDLYPSTSKRGQHSHDNYGGHAPPPTATNSLPGSPAKMAVLSERLTLEVSLWHDRDATDLRRYWPAKLPCGGGRRVERKTLGCYG
jgi:hypothetical protein